MDVDWVRVEDMVELVLLIDEVEVDVSVIVGDILLGAVLVESVVDSDMLELEGVLPDVLLLLVDSVVDSDVLKLVGEAVDEVPVIVEDRDVLLIVLLLVDSVVVSDVLIPVLEEEVSIGVVLMVVVVDSGVVVDVDWVGVEDMVELVVLMDEVEVRVSKSFSSTRKK